MRLKIIACEILARELYLYAASSPYIVDVELVSKELHDEPDQLREELQRRIFQNSDSLYQTLGLLYGLCSNSTAGLVTPRLPLIIPRAHDCITLFLGSREKYQQDFTDYPGTYYYTGGWIERGGAHVERRTDITDSKRKITNANYEEFLQLYGEENARYLMEVLGSWEKNYNRAVYIDLELVRFLRYNLQAKEVAREKGWNYEEVSGNLNLISRLVQGEWDPKDFLLVNPGMKIIATNDENIVGCMPA